MARPELRVPGRAAPGPGPRAAATSPDRRGLEALLRWRTRFLPRLAPAQTVRAARLLPVMLHTSFDRAGLREDAPGVAGLSYRRGWSALARDFGLPPPFKAQRATPLVEAVLLQLGAEGPEAVVLLPAGLKPADKGWVESRTELACGALATAGVRLRWRTADAWGLGLDQVALARLALFGGLTGGDVSPASWAVLEAAARRAAEPATWSALARAAPTPFSSLALTLLGAVTATTPLEAVRRLLAAGYAARRLADPEALLAAWAAEDGPHGPLLGAALALERPTAAGQAPLSTAEVLELGGRLALAAARAVRIGRRGLTHEALTAWREALGAGVPLALRPALAARLTAGGLPRTATGRSRGIHEIRLPGGAALGRGATPVQARVRALALLASAAPEPVMAQAEAPWSALVGRLGRRRAERTSLLVVEPAIPSGPPFDPLNRGPDRALGFPGALLVRFAPGRRPSGRVLTGDEAVAHLVEAARLGSAIEVISARAEAQPVAARLAQLVAFSREAKPDLPVAMEAGGRVILSTEPRLRHYRLDRFMARPRVHRPDPDAPDLALSPGERRPAGLAGPSLIECRAALVDGARASVLYADARKGWLREVVYLSELEEHLAESRLVLQQADPAALLAVRLTDELEPALRRGGRPGPTLRMAVRGALPHHLEVEVGGERFGGAGGLPGWRAAGLAVLARWPTGNGARLGVSAVTVRGPVGRAAGLLALYARSVAVRRVRSFLVRELQALSARQNVPKG